MLLLMVRGNGIGGVMRMLTVMEIYMGRGSRREGVKMHAGITGGGRDFKKFRLFCGATTFFGKVEAR